MVGLAVVDHNPLGSAIPLQRLAQELLGGGQIAPFTKPEFNCVAGVVDSTVEITPLATDLDVCLINMSFATHRALALKRFRGQCRA